MANVFDVANFFIRIANQSEDDQITNLKLNKLLYYAQGVTLARTGKPLFDNPIEAWTHGPVVPDIYHKYKEFRRTPIISSDGDTDRSRFSDEELDALFDVMREFGQYTGSMLIALTHKPDTPWSKTIADRRTELSQSEIREYFLRHPVPHLKDKICVPLVTALPADWYDPKEDAEWEAYL